jgi:hypothetical protein
VTLNYKCGSTRSTYGYNRPKVEFDRGLWRRMLSNASTWTSALLSLSSHQGGIQLELRLGSVSMVQFHLSNLLMPCQVMHLKPLFGGKNVREESCGWYSGVRILLQSNSAREFCCLTCMLHIYTVRECMSRIISVYDRHICSAIKMNVYIPFYRPADVTVRVMRLATE